MPYYRPMKTLEDTTAMNGNCANAGSGSVATDAACTTRTQFTSQGCIIIDPLPRLARSFGKNEMYPCFDSSVTYGLAVTGLAVTGTLPVSLSTDGAVSEPDTRQGQPPAALHGTVTVSGLTSGTSYVLYRYNGTAALPLGPPFDVNYEFKVPFVATAATWTYVDPQTFLSNTATYYVAVAA